MSSERCGIIPVMQPGTKVMQFVKVTQETPSLGQRAVVGHWHKYKKQFSPQNISTGTDHLHKKHLSLM
jgi:hypothetical protein